MEMSIEEAIKYLRALKRCETCEAGDVGHCKSCSCYRIGSSAKCYDAIDVGVDIMLKYNKIKHIINDVPYLDKDEYKIASIKEIIDGND